MIVKICGMRDAENIRKVEQTGADWMGFIFYEGSPRFVAARPAYLPEKMLRIGVFVNPSSASYIYNKMDELKLNGVQLHGNETPECCFRLRSHGLKVIKSFSISCENDLKQTESYVGKCDCFLFDTPTSGYGGSGQSFDWNILNAYAGQTPFLLSGGIRPESLSRLLVFHHPRWMGIDLNSGFETAPGIKNPQTLALFIRQFRLYNPHL